MYSALQYLRRPTVSRVICIDQLCISQMDILEHGSQVLIITDLYRGTVLTLARLGEAEPNTNMAFDLLDEFRDTQRLVILGNLGRYREDSQYNGQVLEERIRVDTLNGTCTIWRFNGGLVGEDPTPSCGRPKCSGVFPQFGGVLAE